MLISAGVFIIRARVSISVSSFATASSTSLAAFAASASINLTPVLAEWLENAFFHFLLFGNPKMSLL